MASHSKPGWRRLVTKTHGTFETIPTLRVPGKDTQRASASSNKAAPKKPAQYADPTLFPGRRLDRRQQSSYSGFSGLSGHSGLSGIDQLTLPSSGRFRTTGSTAGSAKPSSLPSAGFSRNQLLTDSNDPWGTARQLPLSREDSPLTMLRRQAAAASIEQKSLTGSVPLTSNTQPSAVPLASDARWRPATLSIRRPASREDLLESPDSMESHESELAAHQEQMRLQQIRLRDHHQRQLRQQERAVRGRYTPPPLAVDVTPPTQQARGVRHVNPHRRPAHTPAGSPTTGQPQLNKILWALVPDEFANISESGVSGVQPSGNATSTGDVGNFVTVTDLDSHATDEHHVVPNTPRRPRLTEQTLSGHEASGTWSRDDRIFQWLADCDKETTSQSLPTHLPDISYTFKYLKSAT